MIKIIIINVKFVFRIFIKNNHYNIIKNKNIIKKIKESFDNKSVSPTGLTDKLMVNSDQSNLKLIDFGLSAPYTLKKWDWLEDNVGTTLFMAPE